MLRFQEVIYVQSSRRANGQPDWVIQAQIGHGSPAMMKTYSHVRRLALDEAAAVLERTFEFAPTTPDDPEPLQAGAQLETAEEVTSQSDDLDAELREIIKEGGSPFWTNTDVDFQCVSPVTWTHSSRSLVRAIETTCCRPRPQSPDRSAVRSSHPDCRGSCLHRHREIRKIARENLRPCRRNRPCTHGREGDRRQKRVQSSSW